MDSIKTCERARGLPPVHASSSLAILYWSKFVEIIKLLSCTPQVERGVVHKMPNQFPHHMVFAFVDFAGLYDFFLQSSRDPPIHHVSRMFFGVCCHHKTCIVWAQTSGEHSSTPRPPSSPECSSPAHEFPASVVAMEVAIEAFYTSNCVQGLKNFRYWRKDPLG